MRNMSNVITARIDDETLALVDKVASLHDRSRAWVVTRAVKDFLRDEKEFFDSLEAAETSIDRGEYYTQQQMEEWFAAKKAARAQPA
jgi:predicted transcriptional regulator